MTGTNNAGRRVPTHRLRANEKVWTPPSVIVLDTETRWHLEESTEVHRMRLWCAVHVDRRKIRKKSGPVRWGWGLTPDDLADWLTETTRGREATWLYAHNLNFDLATTSLADTMRDHGWTVTDFAVSHGAPWLRLKNGKKVLTVVDSWSWLPESVEALATRMGRRKLNLPDNADGFDDWFARCASDVDITARSILALMEWWDAEQLGRWTISGAGCGWNAMRHTETDTRHVIALGPEDDELAKEAEWVKEAVAAGRPNVFAEWDRRAVRGGRKDSAVIRSETGGPWVEIDLEAAYPTVCRDLPLPIRRMWTFDRLEVESRFIGSRLHGIIADVEINTDRPLYPVRHDGVAWYPVGRFRTVLAGPEIAEARRNGHLISVGAGQVHRLGHALRPWATWVLDPTRGGSVDVPPVGLVACKTWGRSVPGKFAARTHTSEALEGPAPAGWSVMDCRHRAAGKRAAEVTMAGRKWLVTYDGDGENCYPAVLAWIESETRVRLGRVLERLDGAWWTADTDGLLVDMTAPIGWNRLGLVRLGQRPRDPIGLAQSLCDLLAPKVAPLRLRPKRHFDSLAILGPQHLIVGGERRMSGVRGEAAEVAPWQFVARDWPRLKWQMENGRPGEYRRPERTSTFTGPTVHRWVLDSGETRPVRFDLGPDGGNRLLPWADSGYGGDGDVLAPVQYRGLSRVS